MLNTARIIEILHGCFGKVDDDKNPLEGSRMVDVWMFRIVLDETKVRAAEPEMIELLKQWPSHYGGAKTPSLGEEIDYIQAGAVLGDQQNALWLFAFGMVLGWWVLMTPTNMLGVPHGTEMAAKMVSFGMLAVRGYRPNGIIYELPKR